MWHGIIGLLEIDKAHDITLADAGILVLFALVISGSVSDLWYPASPKSCLFFCSFLP